VAPLRGESSDLDGDGWVDLVVSSELVNWSAIGHVISSRTGEFLADLTCGPTHDRRTRIDRVATHERWIAISSPGELEQRGRVRVWNAATRELSLVIEGTVPGKYLGARIAWLDEERLAVSVPLAGPSRCGAVLEIDVKKGEIGRTWRGARELERYGGSLATGHDLDGDGVRDFAVGAPSALYARDVAGAVEVICGATGRRLVRIVGPPTNGEPWADAHPVCGPPVCDCRAPEDLDRPYSDAFGTGVATGDFDGDGLADLAIGFPCRDRGTIVGRVLAISGVELRRVMTNR
jgi:hypothetical protein